MGKCMLSMVQRTAENTFTLRCVPGIYPFNSSTRIGAPTDQMLAACNETLQVCFSIHFLIGMGAYVA